jgi:predicted hydrocarbon binding protein
MTVETGTNLNNLVAMPRSALSLLRETLLREGGPAAASFLQESGFAGGEEVVIALETWLDAKGYAAVSELGVDSFASCLSEYFGDIGWGALTIGRVNDAVAALDSADWWESDPASALDHPGCHISTGLLADLLGRVSGQPLAVLEVECRSMGSERCRFLTGSAEALERVYERMVKGFNYGEAVDALVD